MSKPPRASAHVGLVSKMSKPLRASAHFGLVSKNEQTAKEISALRGTHMDLRVARNVQISALR